MAPRKTRRVTKRRTSVKKSSPRKRRTSVKKSSPRKTKLYRRRGSKAPKDVRPLTSYKKLAKYANRPGPALPANQMCGKRARGNDGLMYVSRANIKGICRWVKV